MKPLAHSNAIRAEVRRYKRTWEYTQFFAACLAAALVFLAIGYVVGASASRAQIEQRLYEQEGLR